MAKVPFSELLRQKIDVLFRFVVFRLYIFAKSDFFSLGRTVVIVPVIPGV